MILEAHSAGCFSWTFVLKLNDRAVGKFEGQWFSENLSIDLMERRHLEFRKNGWLGSQFELIDLRDEEVLGWCDRTGFLTSTWDLDLSIGAAQLVHCGWLDTAYELFHEGDAIARVDRRGFCQPGWIVDGAGMLKNEDLLMIGLVYHTIQHRRQAQQNNAGAAGT